MDSFSAHGDRNEMYDFIANQKDVKKLFLVHGELERQEKFKTFLMERGFKDIEIPAEGDSFSLNWLISDSGQTSWIIYDSHIAEEDKPPKSGN